MPAIDVVIESAIDQTTRVRQLGSIFDCPVEKKQRLEWHIDAPYEKEPWSIGMIVGPSGCGKSTILRHQFGDPLALEWNAGSVIDDFSKSMSLEEITKACSAVGFNTIPAWMRPFGVLSNGEQFRVGLARAILETKGVIVIDEFTSVVDRQVAQVASHAAQKHIRRTGKQMVVASCHYDIEDWLQPDWIIEPSAGTFRRRSLRQRPELNIEIGRVPYSAWGRFSRFHYMSADLNKAARCFGLWCNGELAAFAGVLHRPHPKARNIKAVSRLVALPDYQGLGLGLMLTDRLGAAYTACGYRFRMYPAHPALIRSFDRSNAWELKKKPGKRNNKLGGSSLVSNKDRHCAVFEYRGPRHASRAEAHALTNGSKA